MGWTGGFQEQYHCVFLTEDTLSLFAFYNFFLPFLLSIGWYCWAEVFGLIWCRSHSPRLALLTSFNNNNNNTKEKIVITDNSQGAKITHSIIIFDEIILRWWWRQAKTFLKISLLSVNFEKFTSINLWSNQSQLGVWRTVIGCSMVYWGKFIKVNGQQPIFQDWLCMPLLSPR